VAGDEDQGVAGPDFEIGRRAGEGIVAADDGDDRGPGPRPQIELGQRPSGRRTILADVERFRGPGRQQVGDFFHRRPDRAGRPEHAVAFAPEDRDFGVHDVLRNMIGFQDPGEDLDGRLKLLGHDRVRTGRVELVDFRDIARPDDDLGVGAEEADRPDAAAGGRRVGDGEDDDLGPVRAGQAENVRPADVSEYASFAFLDGCPDQGRIELDDDMVDPDGTEDAGEILAVQAVPGDDHVVAHPRGRRPFLVRERGRPFRSGPRFPVHDQIGRLQEIRGSDQGQDGRR